MPVVRKGLGGFRLVKIATFLSIACGAAPVADAQPILSGWFSLPPGAAPTAPRLVLESDSCEYQLSIDSWQYDLSLAVSVEDPFGRRVANDSQNGKFQLIARAYVTLDDGYPSGRYTCRAGASAFGVDPTYELTDSVFGHYQNPSGCGDCWPPKGQYVRSSTLLYFFETDPNSAPFPDQLRHRIQFENAVLTWNIDERLLWETQNRNEAQVIVRMSDILGTGNADPTPAGGVITIDDRLPTWSDQYATAVMAHEIGHILGLSEVGSECYTSIMTAGDPSASSVGASCGDRAAQRYYRRF